RDELTAETVLRQHAANRLLDRLAGVLLEQVAVGDLLESTGVTTVAVDVLVRALVARQSNLVRVDDDDEIATVHVGRVCRLVLAAQEGRRGDGESTQDDVLGIDDVPLTGDVSRL